MRSGVQIGGVDVERHCRRIRRRQDDAGLLHPQILENDKISFLRIWNGTTRIGDP